MSLEDPKQPAVQEKAPLPMFRFDHEPTFAELWDSCVYLIYGGVEPLAHGLETLFEELKITKDSKIADVAAGAGFPALELIKDGYNVTCTDGAQDEVELFNKKAQKAELPVSCEQILWKDLPNKFDKESFDFLFCRGNSFIYAGGGWNEMKEVKTEESLAKYEEALAAFYTLLKPGGWFYTDKYEDPETPSRETVAQITVEGGGPEDLVFYRERYPEKKMRQAAMIRKTDTGENSVPNITYDLMFPEIEEMMKKVGFINIQQNKKVSGETHFPVLIGQKPL